MGWKDKVVLSKEDKKRMMLLLFGAMLIIVVLLFLDGGSEKKVTVEENTSDLTSSSYDQSASLTRLLEKIRGVGNVSVSIEYAGSSVKTYAYNEETAERVGNGDDGSAETTTSKEMVLLNGDETPVVIEETYPKINGVVVVAEGADDPQIREALYNTVTTYLDIKANRVEICVGEVLP